jgi:hypothetical protein
MRGYVLGEEITALCGEKFIPTRDPYQYPVCEGCRAALTMMNGSDGTRALGSVSLKPKAVWVRGSYVSGRVRAYNAE